jgi:hypothetical protein
MLLPAKEWGSADGIAPFCLKRVAMLVVVHDTNVDVILTILINLIIAVRKPAIVSWFFRVGNGLGSKIYLMTMLQLRC